MFRGKGGEFSFQEEEEEAPPEFSEGEEGRERKSGTRNFRGRLPRTDGSSIIEINGFCPNSTEGFPASIPPIDRRGDRRSNSSNSNKSSNGQKTHIS